ncbi:MAG: hypothetical protein ABIU97_00820, partial [Dehalococcoidia bacterium]
MSFLYFLGALLVGSAIIFIGLRLAGAFRTGSEVPVVLLAAASGLAKVDMWRAALAAAGIWTRIQNVGDFGWYGASSYAYEVWVLEEDLES